VPLPRALQEHAVHERGGREPRHEARVLDGVPSPSSLPSRASCRPSTLPSGSPCRA
jgi:hypothetical protein